MGTATEMAEILAAVDEIKPIIEKALPAILELGSLTKPIVEKLCGLNVEMTHRMIRGYIELGYERHEALTLAMWNKQTMFKVMGNK